MNGAVNLKPDKKILPELPKKKEKTHHNGFVAQLLAPETRQKRMTERVRRWAAPTRPTPMATVHTVSIRGATAAMGPVGGGARGGRRDGGRGTSKEHLVFEGFK